jgi:hypothetical protein
VNAGATDFKLESLTAQFPSRAPFFFDSVVFNNKYSIFSISNNKEYQKEYWKKYSANVKNRQRLNKKEIIRKKRIKTWFKNYKKSVCCEECGEKQAECLDFHHIQVKFKQVNEMVRDGYSKAKIMNEIDKCVVLCGNCHRRTHNEELKTNGYTTKKAQSRRKWMIELKSKLACYNCNIMGYAIIDFHHLRNKEYGINYMVSRFAKEKTTNELIKCVPLCLNCHRKIHNALIGIDLTDDQLQAYWADFFDKMKEF